MSVHGRAKYEKIFTCFSHHMCICSSRVMGKNVLLNLWHQTIHHSLIDVTTAEALTTMPKSASYHPSPKNATFVRASTTWLPAAQLNHSSHHQVLRENSFPWRETKGSTVTWQYLTIAPIKQEIRKHSCRESTKANSNCFDSKVEHVIHFRLWKLLLELPQVKKKVIEIIGFALIVLVIFYNAQENCCIIALRMLS